MILQNPFLHYPKYVARIIFVGGGSVRQNGTSLPNVKISCDGKDVAAICWEAMEASDVCRGTAMYYDGVWHAYDKELADKLEYPISSPPKPEPCVCSPATEKKEGEPKVGKSKKKKTTPRSKSSQLAPKTSVAKYKFVEDGAKQE